MQERKKYGLRPARTPQAHKLLSGVVLVLDRQGKGTAYIHFDQSFVDAVGAALPEGVRPDKPAFIKALQVPATAAWRIFAMYLGEERGVMLWEAATTPLWLAKVRRTK